MQQVILLTPIYVTLFWAIALLASKKLEYEPRMFLGFFMLAALLVYVSHYFYFTRNYTVYFYLDSLYTLAYLLVYPMFHVYIRLLVVDKKFVVAKHFKFLAAPFSIFMLTLVGYITIGKEQGQHFIKHVLFEEEAATGGQQYLKIVFVFGRAVFLLQAVVYLIANYKIIKDNGIRLRDYYSNLEERKLNWVLFFSVCLAVTSVSSGVLAALGRNVFLHNQTFLLLPSIVFSVMLFIVGLQGSTQKPIFTEIASLHANETEVRMAFDLKSRLERLFEKEKVFKNPDLKVWEVCSILGTTRSNITRIIWEEYATSFCDYVNHHRISYASHLIANNKNLTKEQIAELSGFVSVKSMSKFIDYIKR